MQKPSDSFCFPLVSKHLSFLSSDIAEKYVLLTEAQIHSEELSFVLLQEQNQSCSYTVFPSAHLGAFVAVPSLLARCNLLLKNAQSELIYFYSIKVWMKKNLLFFACGDQRWACCEVVLHCFPKPAVSTLYYGCAFEKMQQVDWVVLLLFIRPLLTVVRLSLHAGLLWALFDHQQKQELERIP